MKTEYKFIHFVKIEDKPKTSVWSCRNNKSGDELCQVKWYSSWRQYCSMPMVQAVYSTGCHDDISHFLNQLNQAGRLTAKKLKTEYGITPQEANMI